MSTNPPSSSPSPIAAAIVAAKDLLRRAHDLQLRIAAVHERFGVTMLVGQVLRDAQPAPSERPTVEAAPALLNSAEVRELLQVFAEVQREMSSLQTQVPALANVTWSDSPYAPEMATIEQEFERLQIDLMSLARSPAINSAYRAEMNAEYPALWSDETVDRMVTMLAAVAPLIDGDLLAPRRERQTAAAPTATNTVPEGPIAASELPFPTTDEAIRTELRYSAERDGTPEAYMRLLAARVRTPQQFDAFLRAMVKYDDVFNRGGRQRLLNYQRIEQNQLWQDPAAFLTTYDSNGRLTGDCKSVALAMRAILGLQGRDAVTVESSIIQPPDASGRMESEGHMATIWIETVSGRLVAHRLDTTEKNGGDASVLTIEGNPGETREQLIVRAFSDGPDHTRLIPDQLGLCRLRRDGWAVDLPMNAELLAQSAAIEQAIDRGDYDTILTIVREQIARTPQNLNLRLAEIQMLLLKRAVAADLATAVTGIEMMIRDYPGSRTAPGNYYATRATITAMRKEGHEDLARRIENVAM